MPRPPDRQPVTARPALDALSADQLEALRSRPAALLARLGLPVKKSFGQHFLRDEHALRVIAAAAAAPGLPIVEIGAGLGALTWQLASHGLPVYAVERDRDLAPVLRRLVAARPWVNVLEADAARLDLAVAAGGGPVCVAGNLPYQLTAPLVLRVLRDPVRYPAAVLMMQREVADRLLAGPGSRERSSLGVWAELYGPATRLLELGPHAFVPPPRVHSTVLALRAAGDSPLAQLDGASLERLLRQGFGQRRKMLRNSLRDRGALARAGVDPTARAEDLSAQAWLALLAATRP